MSTRVSRYAICVYFDPEGELRPFMEFFLSSLSETCVGVLLVVNGTLNKKSRTRVESLGVHLLERENKGYDFYAYREGYFYFKNTIHLEIDELIFCNSSCYGPITSLTNVFHEMDKQEVDFWGLTQWHSEPWPDHIQSYFLVFRKRLHESTAFHIYWEQLPRLSSRKDAIEKCEVQLTSYFARIGFKWSTFLPPSRPDYSMTFVHEGLVSGLPLLKRKFFILNNNDDEKKKVLSFLLNQTKYDIQLVYEDFFLSRYLSNQDNGKISIKTFIKCNYPRATKLLIKLKRYL